MVKANDNQSQIDLRDLLRNQLAIECLTLISERTRTCSGAL